QRLFVMLTTLLRRSVTTARRRIARPFSYGEGNGTRSIDRPRANVRIGRDCDHSAQLAGGARADRAAPSGGLEGLERRRCRGQTESRAEKGYSRAVTVRASRR